ncbi:MAG TPA: DUF6159 family protein, partial [Solirubrobacterales bacterium]|nr:DUF6159 family protein [Solirubrobacterales bacterium]
MAEPDPSGTRWSPWALIKGSSRLASQDPSLASLAFLGSGCFLVLLAAAMGAMERVSPNRQGFALGLLLILAGFYAATLLLSFFSAAMAHSANAGFDGVPLTMREAIAEARQDLGAIAIWSLVAIAVGCVLQIAVFTGPAGRLVSFLGSLAWGFLVAYTVPIIALAAASPNEAIRESVGLARRRWGTQLIGGLLIAIATAIAAFVCLMFFVPGLEGLREG